MASLDIILDIQNKKLLSNLAGGPFSLPAFIQGDTWEMSVQCVRPATALGQPGTILDLNGNACTVAVATGAAGSGAGVQGGGTPIAQASLSWNGTTDRFEGSLSCNTTDFGTLLGSLAEGTSIFEIELVDGTLNRSSLHF